MLIHLRPPFSACTLQANTLDSPAKATMQIRSAAVKREIDYTNFVGLHAMPRHVMLTHHILRGGAA
jgi:hypothetical protein